MRASRPEEGGLKEKNSVGEEGRRRHRGHWELLRARSELVKMVPKYQEERARAA